MKGQRNYRNIVAWQRAHEVTLRMYELTRTFPREETYGLSSQIRRASFSVAANIAEGSGRETDKDFLRFLYISLGSLKEVDYATLLAYDLKYLNSELFEKLQTRLNQTFAALQGLIKSVKQKA
jgi:four helix bundle protein